MDGTNNLYGFSRTRTDDDGAQHREVCVGSSPLSRRPYWAKPRAEAVIQPLLFRSVDYAQLCMDIAQREDAKTDPVIYVYERFTVLLPF